MKEVYVISDRYLKTLIEKGSELFKIEGCRDLIKGTEEIISLQLDNLVGILICLSPNFDEDKVDLIKAVLNAGQYSNCKIVIYCGSSNLAKSVKDILIEYEDEENMQIILVNPAKRFTEDFISKNLFSIFIEDNVYEMSTENPEYEMSKMISRVKSSTPTTESDSGVDYLKSLVEQATNTTINIKASVEAFLNNSESVILQDDVVAKIDEQIHTLKEQSKDLEKTDPVNKKISIQLAILDLLRENRSSLITTTNIKEYLDLVRDEFDKKLNDIDLSDINLKEKEIGDLKEEKIRLENEITSFIKSNYNKLNLVKKLYSAKNMREKILLLQDKNRDPEFKEIVGNVTAMSKESLSEFKVVNSLLKQTLIDWNSSVKVFSSKFKAYSQIRDTIDYKNESLITELKNSKNIKLSVNTTLATKLYTIIGVKENMGVSLTASGIASNYSNPLIIDLRLDNSHLQTFYSNQLFYDLSEWESKTIDEIINDVKESKYNIGLPQGAGLLVSDRTSFFKKILTVLEDINCLYDIVIVLVDHSKEESRVFLEYTAISIIINNTNLYNYSNSKKVALLLNNFDNIKIKYLLFTPACDMDLKTETIKAGFSFDDTRVKGIPFIPVDKYKTEGMNIFSERPILRNNFKF